MSSDAANYTLMNSCLIRTDSARQEVVKPRDDADNFVVQLHNRWHNRLKFPPSEIGERYRRDDLGVVLKLLVNLGLKSRAECSLLITRGVLRDYPSGHFGRNLNRPCGEAQDELSMFVRNIDVVNCEQGTLDRVGGVVRLKLLDKIEDTGVCNSLYFSFMSLGTVFVDWPRFEDGKFDSLEMLTPVRLARELPNNVIQARAQMMCDLADENAEAQRDGSLAVVLHSLSEKLHIILWETGVFAFFKKPIDFDLKIKDVLVGPF